MKKLYISKLQISTTFWNIGNLPSKDTDKQQMQQMDEAKNFCVQVKILDF